jgi:hypothetical protein
MVFAKLIFFPPNFFCSERFPFPKYEKKFWREKNQLSQTTQNPSRPPISNCQNFPIQI